MQTLGERAEREGFAEAAPVVDQELAAKCPIAVAWHLSQEAGHNLDQKRPVIFAAHHMETAWEEECRRRAGKRAAGTMETEPKWLTPLDKHLHSMLNGGGGGASKTRITTRVFTKLFGTVFGPRGCLLTDHSNKAARLIGGRTSYKPCKISPSRCTFLGLRVQNATEQRALECH